MPNLIVPPRDLPSAPEVFDDSVLVVDTGAGVFKATPAQVVDVARPYATIQEAEDGVASGMSMTPLTTAAAITARIGDAAPRTETVEVTVGPAGNYTTINSAIAALSQRSARLYTPTGIKGVVRLLTGFIMAEQVILRDGLDLSWIEIISDAATVTITRSALSSVVLVPTSFETNSMTLQSRYPAFAAIDSSLPEIGCQFVMDATGSGSARDGILLVNGRSVVRASCGVRGVSSSRGISLHQGSQISCIAADFSGCSAGVLSTEGSHFCGQFANFSGAIENGIICIYDGHGDAYGADVTNCVATAVECRDSSTLNLRLADLSDSGGNGLSAQHGATVNARSLIAERCGGVAVWARWASRIDAMDLVANDCRGIAAVYAQEGSNINIASTNIGGSQVDRAAKVAIRAIGASVINAPAVKANNAGTAGVWAEKASTVNVSGASILAAGTFAVGSYGGSQIDAEGAIATGATTRGAAAVGGRINAKSANFRKNPASDTTGSNGDIVIFDGGQITAAAATGGLNVTANTISANGIIFR